MLTTKHYIILLLLSAYGVSAQVDNPTQFPCDENTDCYATGALNSQEFSISKEFESAANVAIYQTPLLADYDGDCTPEIFVATSTDGLTDPRVTRNIDVLNSTNGTSLFTIPTAFFGWSSPTSFAVADVDGSGEPVVIIAAAGTTQNPANIRRRLICYEMDGTVRWVADNQFGINQAYGFGPSVSLADFNGDGIPEVYILNEIYNAQTGAKLADGGNNGVAAGDETFLIGTNALPIAAQLDEDVTDLELAAGYTVYKVDISNPNGMAGNSMTPYNITVNGALRDGFTTVGDITGDGELEVIVTSRGANDGVLYVYRFQNLTTELVAQVNPPNGGGPLNYKIGPAFIGDMDGTGQVSIGICRSNRLFAYTYNGTNQLQQKWQLNTNDQSGETGLTMFDFNQDGIQEIVYRDETSLRILNGVGNNVETLASFNCASGTGVEYPIVGDIDGSGQTKICVTCGSVLGGRLEVFASANSSQPWAPSRRVWNQYSYHIFNVNNDLTIPPQQLNSSDFGGSLLNSFFAQAPLLSPDGEYLIPLADLSIEPHCHEIDPTLGTYSGFFSINNLITSTSSVAGNIAVSVFAGTPNEPLDLLSTFFVEVDLLPGETAESLSWTTPLSDIENVQDYFYVVNYDQSIFDIDLLDNASDVPECNFQNNTEQAQQIPNIEHITTELCEGSIYDFFDEQISEPGVYINSIQNQFGCDSVITILTIASVGNSFFQSEEVTACEQYFWNISDQTYNESGVYQVTFTQDNDCEETYELVLNIGTSSETFTSVQACDQFIWSANDSLITTSGTYQSMLASSLGCDSLVTLTIEIQQSEATTIEVQNCGSFNWYGADLPTSGEYNQVFQNIHGCDSLEILQLTIHPTYQITENVTACNAYEIGDDLIEINGSYTYTFSTIYGCDSIVTVNVELFHDQFTSFEETICEGSFFELPDGTIVDQQDTYTTILPSSAQCDSTITTELSVLPTFETTQNLTACENELVELGSGSFVSPPGVYVIGFTSVLTNCDSIVTYNIESYPAPTAHFSWEPTQIPIDAPFAKFTNSSQGGSSYSWIYNNSLISNEFEPTLEFFSPDAAALNLMCLTAENEFGCQDTLCRNIHFDLPLLVYCPNAFTPDNDGVNETFKPIVSGHSLDDYYFAIFNRWGEKIFETTDPEEPWIGNHQQGDYYVPDDIYIWTLSVKALNSSEKQLHKGHVSLIR